MLEYVQVIMPALLKGAKLSLELFALTLIISLPLGLPVALGENSRFAPIRWLCRFFVLVMRGTPLMLQLFFFYFFFPIVLKIRWDAFPTAVFTFALNYSAYFAEIYRGGINGIGIGQYEAAYSLGFSRRQTMFKIILPQTLRTVIPPVANEVLVLIKDTALASAIGMADIMRVSKGIVNRDSRLVAYFIAALMYLIFSLVMTVIINRIEKRAKISG